MDNFPGISADSLFLLAENRFQDSKVFYEEHKPTINRTVVHPLRQLVAELTPAMLAIDPLLGGNVSRVRRDNRFTMISPCTGKICGSPSCGISGRGIGVCRRFIWIFLWQEPIGVWVSTALPQLL